MLGSELLNIEGIGKSRAAALLKAFKSISAIKNATAEELARAEGMNLKSAENVYNYFHNM